MNSGYCIGGSKAGEWISAEGKHVRVELPMTPPKISQGEVLPADLEVHTESYTWHSTSPHVGSHEGAWIIEGVGPEAAMTLMAQRIGFSALVGRYSQVVLREKDDMRHGATKA